MPTKKTSVSSVDDLVGSPKAKVSKGGPSSSLRDHDLPANALHRPVQAGVAKQSRVEKIATSTSDVSRDDVKKVEKVEEIEEKKEEQVEKNGTAAPTPTPAAPVFTASEPRPYGMQRDFTSRMQTRDIQPFSQVASVPTETVSGILDIMPEGHGFLRPKFIPSSRDIYISQSQIRRFMLRPGDLVSGLARPPKDTERYYGLLKVEQVNGITAEESLKRPHFDDLTPIYPKKQITLATSKLPLSTRIMDLVAPIGFGQRGMIVSPPKAGKTTILKEIAAGISQNFPKAHLMAALIGERPEEVTDISQSVRGDVVASNFDEPPENQTRVAEITLDRAKRLVEQGIDVIILLDSVTRLARAYNLSIEPSGRTLTGGFDPAALWPAKRFFGAARNCQEGGSLTIIGTALVETGSRMDDLIFEEFKGTGNLELHLDRRLADRRIFPAINIERSGTRQEELLIEADKLKKIVTVRRMLDMLSPDERTETLIERLLKTDTNDEFLSGLGKE